MSHHTRTETRATTAALLVAVGILLTACGGGGDTAAPPPAAPAPSAPASAPSGGGGDAPTDGDAAVTPAGAPLGEAIGLRIGSAGGSLRTADGALTLTVPPGAFDREHEILIRRIANQAPGAKGGAWRIEPEGLQAALPMTLRLQLGDEELGGTALAALTVGTQDAAGRWHAYRVPERNEAARTVSVTTRHFSDWALLAGVQLKPLRAEVVVGQSLDLRVVDCPRLPTSPGSDTTLVKHCSEVLIASGELDHWAANGIDGGSAQVGTVVEQPAGGIGGPGRARYTEPAAPPPGNPVAVSVDYRELSPGAPALRLVSRVQVVPASTCAWLHGAHQLHFELEMDYHASVGAADGQLTMNQGGRITGTLQRAYDNDLYGLWQGTTTEGQVSLDDSFSEGDRTDRLFGSGAPAIGSGNQGNDFSGMQLLVDYRQCTYAVQGKLAVVAGTGQPNDVPVAATVGSFTRGDKVIDDITWLDGDELMPPRAEASPEGTYAPGGLEHGRLFRDGVPTQNLGSARVRWLIEVR